jgi:hypothetical protein
MSHSSNANGNSTIRLFGVVPGFNVSWGSTRLRFASVILR